MNIPTTIESGRGTHVGIVDSMYELPQKQDASVDVANRERFIDSEEPRTTPHGLLVFSILRFFSPEADFSFYQAVREDEMMSIDAFSLAVRAAINEEIDVLNVSAGIYLEGCSGHCQFCTAVQRAVDSGITVVAAAGNQRPGESPERVNCPATREQAIAVSGMEVDCPAEVDREGAIISDGSKSSGPYWVRKQDGVDYNPNAVEGPFCGQRNCVHGTDCLRRNNEVPWDANVRPKPDKPDVAAPVQYPETRDDGAPVLLAGTSFAAPVVSGVLASMYSELRSQGNSQPTPMETRNAIVEGGATMEGTSLRKLNATRTLNHLSE